ncbi:ABC-three component system protein [Candidatus Sororendozoicomonas aggregata]|uniref:ABC-three component system protein n=1 Tax=Candidatus Sororendozoicomonas aggregata TaxID=3073239 RepID=UPI002ED24BE1
MVYNRVSQEDVTAAGDVAARDIKKTVNNYYAPQGQVVYREDKRLTALIEEHERAILADPDYRDFSEKLNNYLYRRVEGSLRDLTEKLTDGDRSDAIDYAMELKESVSKKILRDGCFTSAQKIYTHLLTQMRTAFKTLVQRRIKSGDFTVYQIDDIVDAKVILPLLNNVEECSLQIDLEDLYGLLYILTGNCYIEWD